MDDRIKRIADHYGYEAQSRQLMEEMGELAQAVNKLWRFDKGYIDGDRRALVESVAKEVADVNIMTRQIAYLTNCEKLAGDLINRVLDKKVGEIEPEPEKMVTVIEGLHSITIKNNNQKSYRWRIDDNIKINLGDVVYVKTKYGMDRAWVVGIKDVPESEAKQYRTAIGKAGFIDEQQR